MEGGPAHEEAEISTENCYELLTEAKSGRGDRDRDRDRVLAFMSRNLLPVLRSPLFGRLTAAERELLVSRRTGGPAVLAVAETGDAPDRGGGRAGSPQPPPAEPRRRRVLFLHAERRRWEELTRLPEGVPARGCGMCTLHNYLFVAGGVDEHAHGGPRASDRVFCFNPLTREWSGVRALSQARSQLRLVPLDGLLYAVGGECLLSVERYDPRADRWSAVAPLPKGAFAVAHEAAACAGQLFVSGGSLFYRMLRYDPRRDEWEECAFNDSRRRSSDMIAHRGHVYRFDVERERAAVSVYKYNTVVKVWHEGARFPLQSPAPFRCAAMGGRIFCVNRSHALQFEAREGREGFLPEVLPPPAEARGALVPFVLCLDQ